jgi:hypothetical protein
MYLHFNIILLIYASYYYRSKCFIVQSEMLFFLFSLTVNEQTGNHRGPPCSASSAPTTHDYAKSILFAPRYVYIY